MAETVRVGAGAGYAGDRWAPAVELAENVKLIFLPLSVWRNEQSPLKP